MKAVIIDAYGGNDVVKYADVEEPEPAAGEVLIRIEAAGVNPIDWKIHNGAGQRMGLVLPFRLSKGISGTVEKFGGDVDSLSEGDAIYWTIETGRFAEYIVAKAANLARKPTNIGFIQAAAIPLGGLTAWQAMLDLADFASGQRLLITNDSGVSGHSPFSSPRHGTFTSPAWPPEPTRRTSVVWAPTSLSTTQKRPLSRWRPIWMSSSTRSVATPSRAFKTLNHGGVMVTSVAFPADEAQRYSVAVQRVVCQPDADVLALMRELVEDGELTAHIANVLPLAEVKEAFGLSDGGPTRGKIVLQIAA